MRLGFRYRLNDRGKERCQKDLFYLRGITDSVFTGATERVFHLLSDHSDEFMTTIEIAKIIKFPRKSVASVLSLAYKEGFIEREKIQSEMETG